MAPGPATDLQSWRDFVDGTHSPMWVISAGKPVLVNLGALELFGASSEQQFFDECDWHACSSASLNVPATLTVTRLGGSKTSIRILHSSPAADLHLFQASTFDRQPLDQTRLVESVERAVLEVAASTRPVKDILDSICRLAEFVTGGLGWCTLLEAYEPWELRVASSPSVRQLVGATISRRRLEAAGPELDELRALAGAEDVLHLPLASPDNQHVGTLLMWVKAKSRPIDPHLLELSANLAAVVFTRDAHLRRLRNKQERLAAISRSMPIGLYQVDTSGHWIYANDRHAQMTGFNIDQCHGEGWLMTVHPEDREVVRDVWRAAQAANTEFRAEYRLADGSHWVMAHETPTGADGRIGTITEITELKLALSAIAEGAERFETLANNIPPFCWMADSKGWVFWYSDRWYDYTGTTIEEMQGWGWQAVHHPDHVDRVVAKLTVHWSTGESWEDTFPLRGKDGKYRWFLSRASPIRDASGNVVRWFGTNSDITEQRQLEAALHRQNLALQRSNEDLSRFAFVASHDLQEPLRMISAYAQLVQRSSADRLDEKSLGHIERIVESAARMSRLIQDLLTYAQASGDTDQASSIILLGPLVDAVVKELRESLEAAGGSVRVEPLPQVCAVPAQIAQVFRNLLSNAIKYRRASVPLQVRISAARQGSHWRISVCDNGEGFEAEHSSRIFDFLKRLHGRDVPGSGIGLAICKTIIERNGGEIGADAVPGEGATLWFTLPASCAQ